MFKIAGAFLCAITMVACSGTTSSQSNSAASMCSLAGGTAGTATACLSVGDYALNQCPGAPVGGASCSADNSHTIATCVCPTGQCWNGSSCQTSSATSAVCAAGGATAGTVQACSSVTNGYSANFCGGAAGCATLTSIPGCICPTGQCWNGTMCEAS